jgi:pimeloyl-ACP methyl ester carboxylesterase
LKTRNNIVHGGSFSILALVLAASSCWADSRLVGNLPRVVQAPLENLPGVDTEYGDLTAHDGARLRTVVTKPQAVEGKLPAVLFVQWLSCDTIEILPKDQSGWGKMLRRLVTESHAIVYRTEKVGVGDSQGRPCNTLDYDGELAYHKEAYERLAKRPDVDANKIVVFGASIGATFAPLIASQLPHLAGVVVWGGGARTWYERQLAFDRRAMELSAQDLSTITPEMNKRAEFEWLYLQKHKTPQQIERERPDLAGVWKKIIGTEETMQYGRPRAFHWQAQQADWAGAWSRVKSPVLVLIGQYDWYEDPRSAELIARIVNQHTPNSAEFHIVPGINHHFNRFADSEAAFRDKEGVPDPDGAVELLLRWLGQRFQ